MNSLLDADDILIHPAVIGELACGTIRNRDEILASLADLPFALHAPDEDVLSLIERRRLFGKGIGWVDSHLLTSALITECEFWTLDKTLAQRAKEIGLQRPRLS